jgi:hypothetical protein
MVVVLGAASLVVVNVVGVMDTIEAAIEEVNAHAWERHGKAAVEAKRYVDSLDNAEHCKWECPDGRDRYVCAMQPAREWAIVVYEAGELVTAFVTEDQAYVNAVIEPCLNPWRYAHP